MKKIIPIILILTASVFVLTSCADIGGERFRSIIEALAGEEDHRGESIDASDIPSIDAGDQGEIVEYMIDENGELVLLNSPEKSDAEEETEPTETKPQDPLSGYTPTVYDYKLIFNYELDINSYSEIRFTEPVTVWRDGDSERELTFTGIISLSSEKILTTDETEYYLFPPIEIIDKTGSLYELEEIRMPNGTFGYRLKLTDASHFESTRRRVDLYASLGDIAAHNAYYYRVSDGTDLLVYSASGTLIK